MFSNVNVVFSAVLALPTTRSVIADASDLSLVFCCSHEPAVLFTCLRFVYFFEVLAVFVFFSVVIRLMM